MKSFPAVCPNCEEWTEVGVSEGALGAVAQCDCGNSFFVSAENGAKADWRVGR